ncbi:MAG: cytochrome c oxidase subunit I [Dehalococcoidia bacterium]
MTARADAAPFSVPGVAAAVAWVSVVDHKTIGRRYVATAFAFFGIGGLLAILMRTQLARPESTLMTPGAYNQVFTMHGTTMIFFFATPMVIAISQLVVPLMIGTRDVAFPRLNAFGYWVFVLAGLFTYSSFLVGEAPDGGWFAYVPLTTDFSPGLGLDFWSLGVLFVGISTTVAAINLIATVLRLRAPGMSLNRMPLLLWGVADMSAVILVALPELTVAAIYLTLDRTFGTAFYDPARGGNPLLWQHLFWIWGHPEVYILLLPALGIVSTVIAVHSRRPIVAYTLMATASLAIGVLSFGLWVHHMFSVGLGLLPLALFSATSFTISIPSGISIFAWLATLWGSAVRWTPALHFALGFIVTFVIGGITGVMVAMVPFDWQAHDTYFVVAHFHYVLVGGVVFPIFAGLHHWWPKFTGRMLPSRASLVSFWMIFIGFNVTFFPQHIVGMLGMPRRVYTYSAGLGWDGYNLISTVGSYALGLGFLLFAIIAIDSFRRPRDADRDPWHGDTLEWLTASPPPEGNFEAQPEVDAREPLWAGPGRGWWRYEDDRADDRTMVATSVLDGRPQAIVAIPPPSALPLLVALALALGFVGTLVEAWPVAIAAGVLTLILVMAWLWEAPLQVEAPASEERDAARRDRPMRRASALHSWGFFLFLLTDTVLVGAQVSSYLLIRGDVGAWPPTGIEVPSFGVPAILTALLVTVSLAAWWAVRRNERGSRYARLPLVLALVAGVAFLVLQGVELTGEAFRPGDHAYASLYFALLGSHAAHVAGGVIALGWCLARTFRLPDDATSSVRLIPWYWHYLGGVWVVLLALVYTSPRFL